MQQATLISHLIRFHKLHIPLRATLCPLHLFGLQTSSGLSLNLVCRRLLTALCVSQLEPRHRPPRRALRGRLSKEAIPQS